jgi:hypothetical protein
MKSVCIRIVSLFIAIGFGLFSVSASPTVSAAATAHPFEGTFASDTLRLQLRYDAATTRYAGSLMIGKDLFPVEGTVAGTSFTGRYVHNALPVPIKVTLAGDGVSISFNQTTASLRRINSTVGPTPSSALSRSASPVSPVSPRVVGLPQADGGAGGVPVPVPVPKAAGKSPKVATVVQPGMRLTFFLGSSSTQTGAVPAKPNDVTATAGAGYTQVNILDVTNGQATLEVRQYVPSTSLNTVFAATTTGSVVSAEEGGDGYWRSPAGLAAMKDQAKGDETVVRLKYPLEGTNYNAIRITTKTATSTMQNTYDLDSGVLLSYGFNGTGANGSAQVVQMLFKSARQVRFPWIGQRPTAAVTGLKRLRFSGQYVTTVDSAYTSTSPLTQDWDVSKVDGASVQMLQTTTLTLPGAAPNQTKANQVVALSGMWIDPKILASLRAGQVLDDDPITHGRMKVLGSQNGTLVISEQNEIQAGASAYDLKSGLVTALQSQLRNGIGTTTVYLQRTQ